MLENPDWCIQIAFFSINRSLKHDQYGNVTATYYLLAEVILKNRLNQAQHLKVATRHSSPLETRRFVFIQKTDLN